MKRPWQRRWQHLTWDGTVSSDDFEPEPTPSRLLAALSEPLRLFIAVTLTFSVVGGGLQILGANPLFRARALVTATSVHVAGNLVASTITIMLVVVVSRMSGQRRRVSLRAAAAGGAIGGLARLPIELLAGNGVTLTPQDLVASIITEATWFTIAALVTNVTTRLARNEQETRKALGDALRRQTAMRKQMLEADLQTRRDIAEWLHGHLQAELLIAAEDARGIGPTGDALAARLTRLRDDDLRTFAHSLHPTLAELNLFGALQDLVHRYDGSTTVTIDADEATIRQALPPGVAVAAYRTCEEAIANAVRHGGAERISISLHRVHDAGLLLLVIENDGRGKPDTLEPGLGLTLVDTYVRTVGGTWDLQFGATSGATLTVTIPLRHGAEQPPEPPQAVPAATS